MPGRLDTVPSAHSRSLASVRFLPQTRTPLRVGAKRGRPRRGSNRALTTGTSVWLQRFRPLGYGGNICLYKTAIIHHFALNWTATSGKAPPPVPTILHPWRPHYPGGQLTPLSPTLPTLSCLPSPVGPAAAQWFKTARYVADINNRQTTEAILVVLVSIESVSSGHLVVKNNLTWGYWFRRDQVR